MLEAAVAAGAPDDIIGWVDVPTLELSNLVMKESDLILATGRPRHGESRIFKRQTGAWRRARQHAAIIDDTADIALASVHHSFQDV